MRAPKATPPPAAPAAPAPFSLSASASQHKASIATLGAGIALAAAGTGVAVDIVTGRYSAFVQKCNSPAEAARRPELAVLSAMAHGESEQGATIAGAVLPVIQGLDDDRARFYYDLVYNSLNDAARRALEAMMKGYEYQSDFAKKYYGQGRTEGRTEEAARALLTVLRARGIAVPDAARERILGLKEAERLERWLERAAVATSLAEVLDNPS